MRVEDAADLVLAGAVGWCLAALVLANGALCGIAVINLIAYVLLDYYSTRS